MEGYPLTDQIPKLVFDRLPLFVNNIKKQEKEQV